MWFIEWITTNWNTIVTCLTSANFMALIYIITIVVKNVKTRKLQNTKLDILTSNLSDIANTKDEISYNSKSNADLVQHIEELEAAVIANNKRLGAILDVMGIVYMRSKDEDVRTAVASVINTFKYSDNVTIENLKLQIEELTKQLNSVKNQPIETNEEVEEVVENTEVVNDEKVVLRG